MITQFRLIFCRDFFKRISPYIEEKHQKNSLKMALNPCSTCVSAYPSLSSKKDFSRLAMNGNIQLKHLLHTLTKGSQALLSLRLSMFISPHGGASSGRRSGEFFVLYLNKWIDWKFSRMKKINQCKCLVFANHLKHSGKKIQIKWLSIFSKKK